METNNTATSKGGVHNTHTKDNAAKIVFGDYIPSFNYLVIPLNKYSKQDFIPA